MFLTNWLKTFIGWFKSDKAKQILKVMEELAPMALNIVELINTDAPNKTLTEINEIAKTYALPTIAALENADNGTDVGNVLANLAIQLLSKYAPAGTSRTVLTSVIHLALLEAKTKAAPLS